MSRIPLSRSLLAIWLATGTSLCVLATVSLSAGAQGTPAAAGAAPTTTTAVTTSASSTPAAQTTPAAAPAAAAPATPAATPAAAPAAAAPAAAAPATPAAAAPAAAPATTAATPAAAPAATPAATATTAPAQATTAPAAPAAAPTASPSTAAGQSAPAKDNTNYALTFLNACKSESVLLCEYLAYDKSGDIRFNSPPCAHYHIYKILKGPPLNKALPIKYEFHLPNEKTPPVGWKFNDKDMMPAKDSKWIIFIEHSVPKMGMFETYQGCYGRQPASEENLNAVYQHLSNEGIR